MRIALFVETYFPFINGVVTHIKVLRDGLVQLGHEVLIVTADPSAKHHYIEDGVLHCPARAFKRLYGFGLASPISHHRYEIIKEFNPDVLHMHQEFGVGLFCAKTAQKLNKPLVYTLHTMYDEYLFYVAPKAFLPAAKKISHKYAGYLAKKAAAVTSPSAKAQDYFDKCKINKSVKLIPNSVEMSKFDPANFSDEQLKEIRKELGIRDGYSAAVFVGRMGKEKSVDVLINNWAKCFTDNDKMHLVLIGEGPELEALKQQAKDLGIADSVTFTGRVDHTKIAPYYAACDMYVSASLTEMMSISMLEGLAAGLPVVQRYDEQNKGQYIEGVTGFTYKTADEFGQIVKNLAHQTPEKKMDKKLEVRQSMKSKGELQLAKYMLSVYSQVTGIKVDGLDDIQQDNAQTVK